MTDEYNCGKNTNAYCRIRCGDMARAEIFRAVAGELGGYGGGFPGFILGVGCDPGTVAGAI